MSTKKSKSAAPKQSYNNPNFKGFINIQLTDEDKATIKAKAFTDADYAEGIHKWCDSGFKFTFSYDDYGRCFQVTGTRSNRDHVDYGVFLTGRGSSPLKAFKQWLYLANIVGDNDWSDFIKEPVITEYDD